MHEYRESEMSHDYVVSIPVERALLIRNLEARIAEHYRIHEPRKICYSVCKRRIHTE